MSKSGFGGKPGAKNHLSQSRVFRRWEACGSGAKKERRVALNWEESRDARAKVEKYWKVCSQRMDHTLKIAIALRIGEGIHAG